MPLLSVVHHLPPPFSLSFFSLRLSLSKISDLRILTPLLSSPPSIPGSRALFWIRLMRRRFPIHLVPIDFFFWGGVSRCSSTPFLRFRSMFFTGIVTRDLGRFWGVDSLSEFPVLGLMQFAPITVSFVILLFLGFIRARLNLFDWFWV